MKHPLGSRERAVEETMREYGFDEPTANRFLDNFMARWEELILTGSSDITPRGIFSGIRGSGS